MYYVCSCFTRSRQESLSRYVLIWSRCTTMNLGWDVDPKVDCVLPLVARCLITRVSLGNTRARGHETHVTMQCPLLPLRHSRQRRSPEISTRGWVDSREREQKSERKVQKYLDHLRISTSRPTDIRLAIMSTFGHLYRVHTYGESHCRSVGAIIDGVPPVSSHLIASRFRAKR